MAAYEFEEVLGDGRGSRLVSISTVVSQEMRKEGNNRETDTATENFIPKKKKGEGYGK